MPSGGGDTVKGGIAMDYAQIFTANHGAEIHYWRGRYGFRAPDRVEKYGDWAKGKGSGMEYAGKLLRASGYTRGKCQGDPWTRY